MGLVDNTAARWSFGRLIDGMAPIRIAVPSWRMPQDRGRAAAVSARVSQAELLDLFKTELRVTRRVAQQPDSNFTMAENMQRACLVRLREALYAV